MTTFYLSFVDGVDDPANGTSWSNPVKTLEYAVETLAASGGPHTILWDSASAETLSADTTITAAQDLRIISVNRSGGDAPLAGAVIGAQATNYSITMDGAYEVYAYGIEFRNGTGATAKNLQFAFADGAHFEFENCIFKQTSTSTSESTQTFAFGRVVNNASTSFVRLSGCTITSDTSANNLALALDGTGEMSGCTLQNNGFSSTFIRGTNGATGQNWLINGCDLSALPTSCTIVGDRGGQGGGYIKFISCKLPSSAVLLAAQTTVVNRGNQSAEYFNCSSGDTHYDYYHGDAYGETTVSGSIYATAGAESGGANVSYKVVTRASHCSYYTPYVGPWIAKYHTGNSAVTPSFEILRDGSATAYQDDEVWGEWSYQGTSGSAQASFVNDRMAPLGTPANQATGDLGASDWTGENATAWFGKLAPASAITPAEVGHIMGRVVVGEPGITVYYDPTIRLA